MGKAEELGAFFRGLLGGKKTPEQPEETPEQKKKREEREKSVEKYRHEYELRRGLEKIEDQIEELQEKAAEKYEKAKEYLKRGDRRNANLQAQACDQFNTMIGAMQRRAAAFEIKISSLSLGGISFDIMQHLSAYAEIIGSNMDPGELNNAFANIDMSNASVDELDNMLKKSWEKDAKKSQKNMDNADVESETMKLIENEVVGEMAARGDTSVAAEETAAVQEDNSVSAQADKGLKELEDLINGLK